MGSAAGETSSAAWRLPHDMVHHFLELRYGREFEKLAILRKLGRVARRHIEDLPRHNDLVACSGMDKDLSFEHHIITDLRPSWDRLGKKTNGVPERIRIRQVYALLTPRL
jgi:hypothetical protein